MTGETVLIAALSARALSQSARRAGFIPLAADAFGDLDTQEAAAHVVRLPGALRRGFRVNELVSALDALTQSLDKDPAGLVLGTGFEDQPDLIAELGSRYRLLGCPADTVRRTKDPETFFPLLRTLGISHPETQTMPPVPAEGWLRKRTGGSGGLHVADCQDRVRAASGHYFQRAQPGTAISALVIAGPRDTAVAWSRQWTSPSASAPYRYGGAAGSLNLEPDLEGRLMDAILAIIPHLGLIGLVSFDFLISGDGDASLIEVNPRPGATIDILDDGRGTLFAAHVSACRDDGRLRDIIEAWAPHSARAAAYLYASQGRVRIGDVAWPSWSADRPVAGSMIEHEKPIATVIAGGETPDAAETSCRERLGLLADLLYEHGTNWKENS